MRQRKETWILTFAGTTQAMQMEQYARAHGLPGKDDPRSAGNYGGLRPFLESSAGRGKRNPCGTSDGGTCL